MLSLVLLAVFIVSRGARGWRGPLQANYTDEQLVTTDLNRKFFYPRCLLFNSCDAAVLAAAVKLSSSEPAIAMSAPSLFRNATLQARMQGHPFLGLTLNASFIYSNLLALEPTHPRLFAASSEDHFRVIYMSQGPKRSEVPDWYSQMVDFLFLSYRDKDDNSTSLYFPHSTFEQGRLSLYVTARILELRQGWLYSYFVLCDDDVGLRRGSLAAFEADLRLWQPAVGGPLFAPSSGSITQVTSIDHFDHLLIAYHREVIEVLYPKETQHNLRCWIISDWLQILEQTFAYRNHLLLLPGMWVNDVKHREYPKKLCTLDKHLAILREALPTNTRGCLPPHFRAHLLYSAAGTPQKKQMRYFDFRHLHNRTTPGCSCWNPESVDCCTVDPDGAVPPSTAACSEMKNISPANNSLLQCANDRSVWYVANQTRHLIFTGAVFQRMGLDFSDVMKIKVEECGERLFWIPEGDILD